MARRVTEVPGSPHRVLMCESDDPVELAALRQKAEEKGWQYLAEGTMTGSGLLGVWLTKPNDPSPAPITPSTA